MLNLLFLLRGDWGSIGDFVTTQRAIRALVGDELLWAEPQKSSRLLPLNWSSNDRTSLLITACLFQFDLKRVAFVVHFNTAGVRLAGFD